MNGDRRPLLGRPVEQGTTPSHDSDQGRSIDLPPLRPSTGASLPVPEPPQEHTRAKNTASEEERAVGERGEREVSAV